ncbi:MAG: glutathione-disulfide reductase [Proteobacteria bacterium]|nr:glutathione-disulfide reductase [Pseudomonadota bacterium]
MKKKFDLIVIGGGSAGLAHAQRAAEHGADVAVIENGLLGGTCVNVGCVPKKVMWYSASYARSVRLAADYGFDLTVNGHDWSALKQRRDAYVARLNGIYQENLDKRNVELVRGTGDFVNKNSIRVESDDYRADNIVIATGGRPIVPRIHGAELGITSDGFFELPDRPERVALAGSGYVAVELSGVFNALGSDTTVLVRKDGMLRSFDQMLRDEQHKAMQQDGIQLETGVVPHALERTSGGLKLIAEDGREFGTFDSIVWAVGRAPNTEYLRLDAAGVAADGYGFVPVDDYQATNVDNIFALGDVTGREALTPVAIAAGRRLADRLYGGIADRHLEYRFIPTVVFAHPPIGTVGMTEADARAEFGDDVRVYESRFTPMLYALGEHKEPSAMKLVTVGHEEKIVGCHVIGDGADEMMQGFSVAVRMGATKKDFDDTVAIHPTSAEEFVTMR